MRIAVVTGASSGLGAEFVRRLARRDEVEELWLIARRADRLEQVCRSVSREGTCRLRAIPLDLTEEQSLWDYQALLEAERPDVRWLVNAAGVGRIGANASLSRAELGNMVLLNAKAAMDVTQISLPWLGRGSHVLEICSTAAFQPLSGLGVYAATKAFLLSYSRSLRFELRPRGICVTAVCPYWIRDTEFIPTAQGTADGAAVRHFPMASRAGSVAAWGLMDASLGLAVSTPGPVCALHRLLAKFVPHGIMLTGWEGLRRL